MTGLEFTPTLAFKYNQKAYSQKPMYACISNFICCMIRLQGFRMQKFCQVEYPVWPLLLKIA